METSELRPYFFAFTKDKGDKATVRFRDNLRKYYPETLKLNLGLTKNDEPVLQLFCYDDTTKISYCRLYSKTHDGPIFPSIEELYNCYNLSTNSTIKGMLAYAAVNDDDRGCELYDFLAKCEIIHADDLEPTQLAALKEAVASNGMINVFPTALEAKKRAKEEIRVKQAETKKRKQADGNAQVTSTEPREEAEFKTGEKATKAKTANEKAANAKTAKTTKVAKSKKSVEKSVEKSTGLVLGNQLDDVRLELKFGDLPVGSMERRALCWDLLAQLVATEPNSLGIPATRDAESLLRKAFDGSQPINNH